MPRGRGHRAAVEAEVTVGRVVGSPVAESQHRVVAHRRRVAGGCRSCERMLAYRDVLLAGRERPHRVDANSGKASAARPARGRVGRQRPSTNRSQVILRGQRRTGLVAQQRQVLG